MTLTARVQQLRTESLTARPTISSQRADLLTDFYRENTGLQSTPVFRANAFAWILDQSSGL